jgi:glycosyltransferase involved in cell wall biosynthesis
MGNKNDIIISVKGRFEVFDISSEINKKGRLNSIFSSYPKYFLRKYGIENNKIINYPFIEILSRICDILISRNIKFQILDYINVLLFEKLVIKKLKRLSNYKYFIGQSAFSLNTFQFLKKNKPNIKIILYVASTHIDEKINILKVNKNEIISDNYYKKIIQEYKLADYIICQSSHVYDSFLRKGHNNVYLNISGVDINNFYYEEKNIFDENYFNIIFVGTITKRKGIKELVNIFNKLKISKKKLFLIGPIGRDIEIKNYLNNEIIYLGKKEYTQLYKYYSSADLLCLLSKEEGFSMVLGQCLSCGTPLISSNVSGAQHLIKDDLHGYVYNHYNEEKIIKKVNSIYKNIKRIRSNKKTLSKNFKDQHSWDKSVEKLLTTIDNFN